MKRAVSQAIVELMREERHDLPWLKRAVQAAIELETATIPPYLCALWSIQETGIAYSHVRSIVLDEMGHMGLMCNLLKALGETPKIVSVAPEYPGPLPGGVRPELIVYLAGLSKEFVGAVCMQIEKPENPLALLRAEETYTSIGKFYEAVGEALANLNPPLSATGQLTSPQVRLVVLRTVTEALAAIDRIKQQGEGTETTPYFEGVLAHYYKFGEIFHGKKLVETSPGRYAFNGDPVPFPRVLPMGRVPDGGWPNRDPDGKGTLAKFNAAYEKVLAGLESAWGAGGQGKLYESIGVMVGEMAGPAQELMKVPLPDGSGKTYGPDFVF